jgi:hypothetical protein
VTALAGAVAAGTAHHAPPRASAAAMLDNVEDCAVSHACHGLADSPPFLFANNTLAAVDQLETASRAWGFTFYGPGGGGASAAKLAAYQVGVRPPRLSPGGRSDWRLLKDRLG